MDLGFGAFLEKFQEFCGPALTRILVCLMGAAVSTVCGGLILKGLAAAIEYTHPEKHGQFTAIVLGGQFIVIGFGAYVAASMHFVARKLRREQRAIRETLDAAQAVRVDIDCYRIKNRQEIDETLAAARMVLDDAFSVAVE